MKIEHFQIFCQVVEHGSFSEVARINFLSQPAITQKIKQIENYYGTILFDRNSSKLSLTESGEILFPFAKEIVEYDKKSIEAIDTHLGLCQQSIKIGASPTIGEYLLPKIIGKFNNKYGETVFELMIGNTPTVLQSLEKNNIDLALVESEVDNDHFIVKQFAHDELVLVVSAQHQWKENDHITIKQLLAEKIIWREQNSGMRHMIEEALQHHRVLENIQNTIELGSIQAIKSAVEANLGVSILPKITIEKELEYGVLKQIEMVDFSLKRNLSIVKKPQRFTNRKVMKFRQFVKDYFEAVIID